MTAENDTNENQQLEGEPSDSANCSLLYDETTVGEIVRWYAHKCRNKAVEGDYEGAKRIADDTQGFDLIVQQFHIENRQINSREDGVN